MNTNYLKIAFARTMFILVVLAVLLSVSTVVNAASPSSFIGKWEAVDVDGSKMALAIGGPPAGPFQITWTDNYISFCGGAAGIIRGTGWINEGDPTLLEADVHLECFTTSDSLDFHVTFRYHSLTNTLSVRYLFGEVTIWHRPGGGKVEGPPALSLRVNYGDNWVEGFYEEGHTVWVSLTDGEGNQKATAELMTEAKDYWGGETGFQSMDGLWFDVDGNLMDDPPSIQPYDWVYAWVDNGASAQVQIGEIRGVVDLASDSISGTIYVPWFSDELQVECFPWGAPEPTDMRFDAAYPDGADTYACAWEDVWDIQSGQTVGIGYFGADGHWVANAFRNARFDVFPEWNAVEGWEWPEGNMITATIFGKEACLAENVAAYSPDNPWSTFVRLDFPGECVIEAGDVVILNDDTTILAHTVRNLTITNVDKIDDIIAGTADSGEVVHAWVHGYGENEMLLPVEEGIWLANFGSADFDLVEGMCGRSEIRDELGNATSVDWCIPSPRFSVFPEWEYIEGWDWPDGVTVSAEVDGKEICSTEGTSGHPDWDPNALFVPLWFPKGCDVVADDIVRLTDGTTDREYTVQNLAVTTVDPNTETVTGTADPGAMVNVWPHGFAELLPTADENGDWLADFSSIGTDLVKGMGGRAEIRDEMGNATTVEWRIPDTRFTVWPEWNYLEGYEWPDGAVAAISVYGKEICSTEMMASFPEWDPSNTFFSMNFPEGCDIEIGDFITLEAGSLAFTHQVQDMSITAVDLDNNTLAGIADFDPEAYILHTWIHGMDGSYMQMSAEEGTWLADFGSQGIDLQLGMGGRVELVDQNSNATAVEWYVPRPWLNAFPEWDEIYSYEWPAYTDVDLTINDEYVQTVTVEPSSWDPNVFTAHFVFGELYNLKAGDVVTLSGTIMDLTYTVQNIFVTEVSEVANTISGTADPDATVYAFPHATWQQLWETADGDGNWQIDFTGVYDWSAGDCGRAEIRDEFGSSTAVDWCIPNPRFTVFPEWEWFDGNDWPDGEEVLITVEDKPECETIGISQDNFFNGGFGEGCDIIAGDIVTFTDGVTVRTHTIQNLAITGVDVAVNTVAGTADTGAVVYAWVHEYGYNQVLTVVDGTWLADFGAAGLDLQEGMGGRAEVRDSFGNSTAVDWYISKPRIVASITEDWFFVMEFAPNATLNYSVYATKDGPELSSGTAETDDSGFAWVNAEGNWDIEPGIYLVISDGTSEKDLVVEGFTFDIFNLTNGQLSGTAPEPYGRNVWVGIGFGEYNWDMVVNTDEYGAWLADFGTPVPSNYQWVAAQIFDEDGDVSELRPERILNDWVIAFAIELPPLFGLPGEHKYYFEADWLDGSWVGENLFVTISDTAPMYDGYVLLRPFGLRARMGDGTCQSIDPVIFPGQLARFHVGFTSDPAVTYEEALAFFENFQVRVVLDEVILFPLFAHEIVPSDQWPQYMCSFTEP